MKKEIALLVAAGCIGAGAATVNYDLLGRKGSKMNSPMVYRNIDYSKMKKKEQQNIGSSLDANVLAKKASGLVNGAYSAEGRFFNRGWTGANDCYTNYSNTNYRCFYNFTAHSYSYPTLSSDRGSLFYAYGPYGDIGYIERSNEYFKYIPVPDDYINPNFYTENSFSRANNQGYSFSYNNSFNFNNPVQTSPYGDGSQIQYKNFKDVRDGSSYSDRQYISVWYGAQNSANYGNAAYTSQPYTWAVEWKNDWTNVGIYVPLNAMPVKMAQNDQIKYVVVSPASYWQVPSNEIDASKTFKILKNSSKKSDIYVGSAEYPSYPSNIQKDNIYMGLRVRKPMAGGFMPSGLYYSDEARTLDNYIYTNRTVEIVAAGEGSGSNRNFANIAHAVNAITVGAVDPTSGNATAYTPNVRPRYCTSGIGNCNSSSSYNIGTTKPEISNYTHFYFNEGGDNSDKGRKYTASWGTVSTYDPYYDGTSISAAYTAGMVSDLLATNAFYRRHPEVVKATLLTSASVTGVPTYATLLPPRSYTDVNHAYPYKHESRFWVGDINKVKTHEDSYGRKEIRFKVKTSDFESNNFVAAISWLSSGDDIANLAKIPQDFDLRAYANNSGNLNDLGTFLDSSLSSFDAFEKVSFSTSANYIVFVITLYSDDANSENRGQVVLGFDMMSR